MTIDYWCNAFTPDRRKTWHAALEQEGVSVKLAGERDGFAEPEAMVARMDEHGIRALVLPTCELPPHAGPTDFESVACRPHELSDFAKRFPGRFYGGWSIDPRGGTGDVARAEAALKSNHIVALHLHTHSYNRRFDDADYDPYYTLAADHGIPVVMQAGASGGNMPSECAHPIGIDRPAISFPNVNFVLSHTGFPWVEAAVSMALKFPNVYLGCATYSPRHWPAEFRDFACGSGNSKVLFGSGFPVVPHSEAIAGVKALDLDADVEAELLGGTARRLFRRVD
ncbi:MAG: amidohydrolase family protein [Myxococcota bacterium]|nr:amidohydrolase family protein [Myxococcota bacterium]